MWPCFLNLEFVGFDSKITRSIKMNVLLSQTSLTSITHRRMHQHQQHQISFVKSMEHVFILHLFGTVHVNI